MIFFLLSESALSSIRIRSALTGIGLSEIADISAAVSACIADPSAPSTTPGLGYVPDRSPEAIPLGLRESPESSRFASVTAAFNSTRVPDPRLPMSVKCGFEALEMWPLTSVARTPVSAPSLPVLLPNPTMFPGTAPAGPVKSPPAESSVSSASATLAPVTPLSLSINVAE